ncbi:MAG: hypothetical protein ACI86H_000574 [bacterium]|jgi:hypothetical protein
MSIQNHEIYEIFYLASRIVIQQNVKVSESKALKLLSKVFVLRKAEMATSLQPHGLEESIKKIRTIHAKKMLIHTLLFVVSSAGSASIQQIKFVTKIAGACHLQSKYFPPFAANQPFSSIQFAKLNTPQLQIYSKNRLKYIQKLYQAEYTNEFIDIETRNATEIGKKIYVLESSYRSKIKACDQLSSFIRLTNNMLSMRFGIETGIRVLTENLDKQSFLFKAEALPLNFRTEPKNDGTFRIVLNNPNSSQSDWQSVCDNIRNLEQIKINNENSDKIFIDDQDFIRLIRLHSEDNRLFKFKQDDLSQIAFKLYQLLIQSFPDIKILRTQFVDLLNQTKLDELSNIDEGVAPEDCKELLSAKFKTVLPVMNEKKYYAKRGKIITAPSRRTENIIDQYQNEFNEKKKNILGQLKSTFAILFWLRKFLTSIVKKNLSHKPKNEVDDSEKLEFANAVNYQTHIVLGISNTIADSPMEDFYMDGDDIVLPKSGIQRADKRDTWVAVSKGETLHKLLKKEFFGIIQDLITNDLNPALKSYGLLPINLKVELLPEIKERIDDDGFASIIRDGLMGTGIENLDTFMQHKRLLFAIQSMFKGKTGGIHYTREDKLRLISSGIFKATSESLQMKYRRLRKTKNEATLQLKQLKQNYPSPSNRSPEYKRIQQLSKVRKMLDYLIEAMELAKPMLKKITDIE